MKLFGNVAMRTLSKPNYTFSVVGNTHLQKDAEVKHRLSRTLSSKSIQQLIILLMLSSLEQEEQDSELLLVQFNKDSKQLAYLNSSLLAHIPQLPKEVSMPHLETCILMTGDGTPMIQLREVTGLETKMPFTICVNKHQMPFINWNHMGFPSQELKKAKFINELSEVNPYNTEKVSKF